MHRITYGRVEPSREATTASVPFTLHTPDRVVTGYLWRTKEPKVEYIFRVVTDGAVNLFREPTYRAAESLLVQFFSEPEPEPVDDEPACIHGMSAWLCEDPINHYPAN
jgi:hypothetical protein